MTVKVLRENGEPVAGADVGRSWNHYLGDGWKASLAKADTAGTVHFVELSKRVPILLDVLTVAGSIPGHYYAGGAGSVRARDPNDYTVWQEEAFNDRDCCPATIVIGRKDFSGGLTDDYITFGEVIPNE